MIRKHAQQDDLVFTLSRIADALEGILERTTPAVGRGGQVDAMDLPVSPSRPATNRDAEDQSLTPSVLDELAEIRRLVLEKRPAPEGKEWYDIKEAADETGFKPYTIRQACNVGRIKADWRRKHPRTGRWRIHRDAILWIRNHGLPAFDSRKST